MCKAVREMRRMERNEGRREGMAKGMEKGVKKVIVSMLRRDFSPKQVHQMTGIPLKLILEFAAKLHPVVPTAATP